MSVSGGVKLEEANEYLGGFTMTKDQRTFFDLLTLERRSDGWWGQMPGTDWMGPWDDVVTARRSIGGLDCEMLGCEGAAEALFERDRRCGQPGAFVAPTLPETPGGRLVAELFPRHATIHVYAVAELLSPYLEALEALKAVVGWPSTEGEVPMGEIVPRRNRALAAIAKAETI